MKRLTKKPWFGPRVLGWGWQPASWEGWVSMLTFFGIIAIIIYKKHSDLQMALYVLVLVGLFMIFCYLTGGNPGSKPLGK